MAEPDLKMKFDPDGTFYIWRNKGSGFIKLLPEEVHAVHLAIYRHLWCTEEEEEECASSDGCAEVAAPLRATPTSVAATTGTTSSG